jgi:hypothetical protein
MSTSAHPLPPASLGLASAADRTQTTTRTATVPWYVWCGVLAVTSANIGGAWDVSWHRSIGRDTFWTPAHMAIYACGVLAGVICSYLILATTFGRSERMKAASVNVLGLRAPLGAFVAAWGGLAMLTSAPFDNWWHAAYGLDVKIVSPPHTLLILGIRSVGAGIVLLILAEMNRVRSLSESLDFGARTTASETSFRPLQRLFLYCGGLMIAGQMFFLMEYTWDVRLHSVSAYVAMAIALPAFFALLSQASRFRWAATTAAAVYTLFLIVEILIFPLFPATPKLGPVFFPVTHLVPAKFPILILLPALALDLFWQRVRSWKPWQIALASGFLFTAVLVAVEWPFASFLLSKASENRFFGTIYFDYNSRPDGLDRLRQFFLPDSGSDLAFGLLRAAIYGSIGTWIGLRFGNWMRTVQR